MSTSIEGLPEALNARVNGLAPSATVAINDRSNRLQREGRRIVKLGLGQSPFPVPEPVVAALQAAAGEKDYLPVQGLRALQETVSDHHQRTFGIRCRPEDVLIGPGSKELMFLLQLAYDGELVLPAPSWVSYGPQARILGRRICSLPTSRASRWLLKREHMQQLCDKEIDRPRLLVLNYPSNPAGTSYTPAELQALAEVARRRRLLVLSDEIYGKLHHTGGHRSIVPMLPEQTIFSGGLSKWCGAGGWRLGLFVFPERLSWLRRAIAAVATETFTSTAAPIQHAAVEAFEPNTAIDEYLRDCRRVLRALGRSVSARLRAAGAELCEPAGGFYCFPDFSPLRAALAARGIASSAQLCERALEEIGVAMLPGSDFGRPAAELTTRIAYVDFDGAAALAGGQALQGASPDEAFLQRYCGKVLEGIDRLAAWLAG